MSSVISRPPGSGAPGSATASRQGSAGPAQDFPAAAAVGSGTDPVVDPAADPAVDPTVEHASAWGVLDDVLWVVLVIALVWLFVGLLV